MGVSVIAVSAASALPRLADAVRSAKGDNPLTPVTVVVPTNAVGVTARRWLGTQGGVAAIEFVTPARLAERIAGAELAAAGRLPISTPLIDITVREVLRHAPGDYEPVATHPSTVTTLRDLHRELRLAGPRSAAILRGSSRRGFEAARVSSMVAERLEAKWFDEADLIELAIERVSAGHVPFDKIMALLPNPTLGLPAQLFGAIGERVDLQLLVEVTDLPAVDAEVVAFAESLGGKVEAFDKFESAPTVATIISTTDADEEVRHAVRSIVDAARSGTSFARMAIVWPTDRPYARLVEHHLGIAGIEWNGRPGTLVSERLVPRFLLDLLQIDRRGLRRNDVFDFLADLPVRGTDGERVSVARWERVARAAGVSRDDHWAPRLAALARRFRAREQPRERDAEAADQLAEFIVGLRRDLGHPGRTRSWQEWADWCESQVLGRLGGSVLDQLDEAERLASDHASKVLDRLRYLDNVSAPVTRNQFRSAFEAEFEAAPGRLGRIGTGVTIGSLAGTTGLAADLTVVLGAADGLLPPAPVIDPLLTDADRRSAGLASSDARTNRLHRSFLGHLTTSRQIIISVPRGDLRSTADRLPSRWITDHLVDPDRSDVSSHLGGLLTTEFPTGQAEHRLRARAAASLVGPAALATACAGDIAATRALAMRAARKSDIVTVYDGDLTGIDIPHFEKPVSPSRIEAWPACPHAYLMRHVLGVYPIDDPSDDVALSPMERGNVVHDTLDRFNHLVISGELPQPGPSGWMPEHVAALETLFDDVAAEFERTGRTGRAAHWYLDRHSVRADLLNWFVLDGKTASARGVSIVSSEQRFGYDDPVTLPLPDGRALRVSGFIDRIDEHSNGDLVVMDHKSGSAIAFSGITADDPTEGATKFQLPVYAAGALTIRGESTSEADIRVLAEYDFFGKGKYARPGYTFDANVWQRVAADLGHVVDGVESGLFPAVTEPPKWEFRVDCRYCQPDGLGVHERYAEWSLKRHDPRLARWFPVEDDDAST